MEPTQQNEYPVECRYGKQIYRGTYRYDKETDLVWWTVLDDDGAPMFTDLDPGYYEWLSTEFLNGEELHEFARVGFIAHTRYLRIQGMIV